MAPQRLVSARCRISCSPQPCARNRKCSEPSLTLPRCPQHPEETRGARPCQSALAPKRKKASPRCRERSEEPASGVNGPQRFRNPETPQCEGPPSASCPRKRPWWRARGLQRGKCGGYFSSTWKRFPSAVTGLAGRGFGVPVWEAMGGLGVQGPSQVANCMISLPRALWSPTPGTG